MIAEMERRRIATEKTLLRYRGKAFDWSKGVTCAHLARTHLRNMGRKPPKMRRFRSALGAKKALVGLGFEGMADLLDSVLPRIRAAEMALGDLALVPGEGGLDAVLVCAGPRRMFGWHGTEETPVMIGVDLDELTGAWRV